MKRLTRTFISVVVVALASNASAIQFGNSSYTVSVQTPESQQVAGFWSDITNRYVFGGMRDQGDFFCSYCSVIPSGIAEASSWGQFITTTANPILFPGAILNENGVNMGYWKPGDTIALCNGSGVCVVLTWHPNNGTVGWFVDPDKISKAVKVDKGKYKNKTPTGAPVTPAVPPGTEQRYVGTPITNYPPGTEIVFITVYTPIGRVIVGEPTVVPTPSQPVGGGACVQVDTMLPGGIRAGDVKLGDILELGDGVSSNTTGVVTYSQRKTAKGYRIETQSGITLRCSAEAPIMTDLGYVLAPELLGKRVATRVDEGGERQLRFETVEAVDEIGAIDVQHITVGDRAFWAGESAGAYILHHNMKADQNPTPCWDPSLGC